MGWRYLLARVDLLNETRAGTRGQNPESWSDPVSRRNFDELDEKRRKLRGG